MRELFETEVGIPLAERIRAKDITEVVGQNHLINSDGILGKSLKSGNVKSMIFWGPPGCGKTTIAKLIAKYVDANFISLSAVFSGVADLKKVFEDASNLRKTGQRTILFVDEIHRFNRAQQDSFLPYVENGTITLIGATTENPSFEINSALLSRCQVLILNRLDENALNDLILRAEKITNRKLKITDGARKNLLSIADGDGRYLLNMIEIIFDFQHENSEINEVDLNKILQRKMPNYDKSGDGHYSLISALHKSVRGSDPQASLYWLARMIIAGEDIKYLLRRLVRMATEDIGLAEPNALPMANATWEAYNKLGSPEGDLAVAELIVFLATAPKSNSVYDAFGKFSYLAKTTGSLPPPSHIINAPTKLMQSQGFGKDYIYDPDTKDSFSGQNYFPDGVKREEFYKPVERGFEREIKKRLDYWVALRKKKSL